MMRSAVRVSARLTSTLTPSYLPSLSAVTPRVIFRAFSAASTVPAAAPTAVTTTTAKSPAAPPANLRSLRRDLSRLLDEDASDLASAPDPGLLEYIKEMKLKIVQDRDGLIRMTRTAGDYTVTVTFNAEIDEGMAEEEAEGQREMEEKAEGKTASGEEEEETDDRLPGHTWEVDVVKAHSAPAAAAASASSAAPAGGAAGAAAVVPAGTHIKLNCATSRQGQFTVESINLNPDVGVTAQQQQQQQQSAGMSPFAMAYEETKNRLFFEELSEGGQQAMYELLAALQVDDKLGQFVQHYAQVVRTQGYLDKLKNLKAFFQ
jgi:hypothetical protein